MKTLIIIFLEFNLFIGVPLSAHGDKKHTDELEVVQKELIKESEEKLKRSGIKRHYASSSLCTRTLGFYFN